MQEKHVGSLGWEDPLEEEIATQYSTLAWKIPWTEEASRLQSMGWQRVRHDFTFTFHNAYVSCPHSCNVNDKVSI